MRGAGGRAKDRFRRPTRVIASRANFYILLAIGVIDSATRMGFLTFLPFLLRQKGASVQSVGFALTLVFAGGALGKFVCGRLGARLGTIPTVFLTEGLTAACILLLVPLPLVPAFALLPILGIMLNGTSSVLYGSVPELVDPAERRRAFAIFYTGTIGSGAISPVLYGLFSDALGIAAMMGIIAGVVLLTLAFGLEAARRVAPRSGNGRRPSRDFARILVRRTAHKPGGPAEARCLYSNPFASRSCPSIPRATFSSPFSPSDRIIPGVAVEPARLDRRDPNLLVRLLFPRSAAGDAVARRADRLARRRLRQCRRPFRAAA